MMKIFGPNFFAILLDLVTYVAKRTKPKHLTDRVRQQCGCAPNFLPDRDASIKWQPTISKTTIPYLDRRLVFPLHLGEIPIFPKTEVYIAQYELVRGTNMFDYAVSLFKRINPDNEVPQGE